MHLVLLFFLLVITLAIIFSQSNVRSIIMLSVFSMISAMAYYLYQAPDVAMAELAIGAAIVPLIYVISIARQKKFIVVDDTMDNFLAPGMTGHMLLSDFCKKNNLDLVVLEEAPSKQNFLLSSKDIDLIVEVDRDKGRPKDQPCSKPATDKRYLMLGSRSSFLFSSLEASLEKKPCLYVRTDYIKEDETLD